MPIQIKEEYIIGDGDICYNIYDELKSLSGKKISLTIETTGEKEKSSRITDGKTLTLIGTINKIHTVEEFKNKDILYVCQQYFDWLKETVNTCVEKFG